MGIGNKILDPSYVPADISTVNTYGSKRIIKIPVSFTEDPLEYMEGFLEYKLRPIQRNMVIDLFSEDENGYPKYDTLVAIIGMRCLGLGTEVLMYDGTLKKIEDIIVGDLVMGPDSKSRKVTYISKGTSKLYKVKQSNGINYIVNENHTLSLKDNDNVNNITIVDYLNKSKSWKLKNKGYKYTEAGTSSIEIEDIGVGEYAGFEVDKDHLFCLSDGTVTHNSGKSVIAALIASFLKHKLLAMDSPGKQLGQAPGQKLVAEFISTSELQSKNTAYAAFENIIRNTVWWQKYIAYLQERELTEGKDKLFQLHTRKIAFPEKNIETLSLHSNSNSLAGYTAFCVVGDEWSRLAVSDGAVQNKTENSTAQAIYYTSSRAAKSIAPFSKVCVITSPMYEGDFGMKLLCRAGTVHAGKHKKYLDALRDKEPTKVKRMIGYYYTTIEVHPWDKDNPTGFTEESFAGERAENPTAYLRDYEALPPSAISPWIEYPERIEECVYAKDSRKSLVLFEDHLIMETVGYETRSYIAKNVYPTRSDKMTKYFVCCDQGEVEDSFCIAMGHAEEISFEGFDANGKKSMQTRYRAVIDFVEEWKPDKENRVTVSFQNVEDVIRVLNTQFRIDKVVYDRWQSTESIQRLFSEGIVTERLGATVVMYDILKQLIYSNMILLPDEDKLILELRRLNKINKKHSIIDHPSDSTKDLSDAVCRTVYCIYEDSIKDAIQGNHMLPIKGNFPTLRSVNSAYSNMITEEFSGGNVFSSGPPSIFGSTVFGRGEQVVKGNIIPNLK